jgi:hypothetical protein
MSNVEEINKLNVDLFNHLCSMAKEKNPTVDINLIEYSVASYLYYDVNKIEKPIDENEDFIKSNNKIKELIEETKKVND